MESKDKNATEGNPIVEGSRAPEEPPVTEIEREALLAAQKAFEGMSPSQVAGLPSGALASAQARLAAALAGSPQPAENLVEGGPLGWNTPPIQQWTPEIDAPIGEMRKQLALYFPDWVVAVWPTAVPQAVIDALKADEGRPESERLVELSHLHTIQIECSWMPDTAVQRRLAQGASMADVKGPDKVQFIASPFTCQGPPDLQAFVNHIGQALLDVGAVQRDPAEVLAERKQAEVDEALRVLRENGVGVGDASAGALLTSGPVPKDPGPMSLEAWEKMSEPDKAQWQKDWAAWEAYRSPGPPPVEVARGGRWEETGPPGPPFIPPDAYTPGQEAPPWRGRARSLEGPNGARPWFETLAHGRGLGVEASRSDPEIEMIEHLIGLFQGWGRTDTERVLHYVRSKLCG